MLPLTCNSNENQYDFLRKKFASGISIYYFECFGCDKQFDILDRSIGLKTLQCEIKIE